MTETLIRDLRYAIRLIGKDRVFSWTSIAVLAAGIASITVVFSIVNAMVFRGLPVENPDRIVRFTNGSGIVTSVSYRDVEDWRGMASLAGIAAYRGMPMTVRDEERLPEVFSGSYIEPGAFRLLGEQPMLGRDMQASDGVPGAPPVVILAASLWKSRYSGDPGIIGRTLHVNNVPSTVIGIMPEGFKFPLIDELWQPLHLMPGFTTDRRDARVYRAFARLRDGVALTQARAELQTIAARLAREHPATNGKFSVGLSPFTGDGTQPMYVWLFVAAGFVLLTACASVATLLLVRSAHRAREVATRLALGATRGYVVRGLLAENAVLVVVAGVLGLAISLAGLRVFALAVEGINFPYWYRDRWTMDVHVFGFLALVCLATGFTFGLAPAIHVFRTSLTSVLNEGARTGSAGGRLSRWTDPLSVAQLALTLILLTGASLMMRSYVAIYRADLVVETSRLMATSLRLTGPKYATPAQRTSFLQQLEDRLNGLGPVSTAAVMNAVPFVGGPDRPLVIDGRPLDGNAPPMVSYVTAGDRYFDTLGLKLLSGRAFTPLDGTPGNERAIVNQRFVSLHFPNENPIGRRIRVGDANDPKAASWLTISGVAPTVRQQYLQELDPVVYVPHRFDPAPVPWLLVRAKADDSALTPALRHAISELDPDLALGRVTPMTELASQSRWAHRVFGMMFALFAVAALLVSAVGLFAVTAYAVARRTQEIGVRMALGAARGQVLAMFARGIALKLAVGLIIGVGGAFAVGRLLQTLVVQTSSTDPVSIIASGVVLISVGAIACCVPAWRATRLDPAITLRHE